ncbi:MAG: D-ribose pyranase [Firmicutes bacterium]|jgi:D-ribose pyranase|nr:D-ribose pyranase [Bacillota bacterium]
MKKQGMVNHFVSEILAGMGHTDRLVVTDMGFPIPQEAKKVDLTVRRNLPTFFDVLEAILEEFQVEKVILAAEMPDVSPEAHARIKELLPDVEYEYVPHWDLVDIARTSKGVIRTGDLTPYCNIVLVSGVKGIFYE